MITICFVYFRCLTLAALEAALYSLQAQDFSRTRELIIVDNNSQDSTESICTVLDHLSFPVPVFLHSYKHGNPLKTHAWSTNIVVQQAQTPWVFFTRADYLLNFDILQKFTAVIEQEEQGISGEWNGFVTSNGSHLRVPLETCELTGWREQGPVILQGLGTSYDYTCIDTGVWIARRAAFDAVGGLNEQLTAWGHSQTHFQWKLHKSGVEFKRIPEVLFYHPQHGGEKDLGLANQQVMNEGLNLQEMWSRYEGPRMY